MIKAGNKTSTGLFWVEKQLPRALSAETGIWSPSNKLLSAGQGENDTTSEIKSPSREEKQVPL